MLSNEIRSETGRDEFVAIGVAAKRGPCLFVKFINAAIKKEKANWTAFGDALKKQVFKKN
jgi:hypothetical protein